MKSFTNIWGQSVVRFRWPIIIVALTCLGLAGFRLTTHGIPYDNSNEVFFIENDPNLVSFDNLLENFGDTEYLVVGLQARDGDTDVFNAATVQALDEITQFLENHPHVTQVRSLSKYQYTHDDGGLLATDDLFENIETLEDRPEALGEARDIMTGERLAIGTLITQDFRHTRIAARIEYIKDVNYHNVKVVTDLRNFITQQDYAAQGFQFRISGSPLINERFETIAQHDQIILNPAMAVVLAVILLVVFRSLVAASIPAIIIVAALILLGGVQSVLGYPNTTVSSALIPTMIILTMGATVHVLVEFYQLRRNGLNPRQAATNSGRDLFYPILFTSLTTALGFIALSITEVKPIRQFSVLTATGTTIIFLLSTVILPALLSFIPWVAYSKHNSSIKNQNRIDLLLSSHIPVFARKNRYTIATIGLVITAISLYSVTYIHADSNVFNYFKQDTDINRDLNYFNDEWKGISNLEVIVDTGEEGGVKDPATLKRVDQLQTWLESLPETGQTTSLLDFYKKINQALHHDNPAYYQLPISRQMAAQFLLLYENTGPDEDLSDLKDFNEQMLRISVPVTSMNDIYVSQLMHKIERELDTNYADLILDLTGSTVLGHTLNVYVNQGMLKSFGVAILVIGVCFLVLFRSLKFGIIALIPSIVPVIFTGGLISFAGIAMNMGTMIVGAMTIGLAVDDSIHIMSRYRLMRSRHYSINDAMEYALNTSGKAVVLTSIILVSGFSVMLFGNFIPYIHVGLFSANIMVLALIGDLIFMPALIYLLDSKYVTRPAESPNPTCPPSSIDYKDNIREVQEHA